ncbi:DNA/RNA nuclease SfsA [Thalassospira mesophila]|uniref:Sugar fermentation stimulation protein homolog n=1 Tax=Thalassospira mesophila TaxID=1293891 RepID=A0A1Y2L284_9PROT|nr:DNA/RNA nuclease SfsA [Thalassospira mesophila]OSQ38300.1 sugar fermentation stimulation protein [Thalassospira mesophila]
MDLPHPLLRGRLILRYKRFLADIELENGDVITAHCANPGAMTGLKDAGLLVWVSTSDNPKRKLKHSWELCQVGDAMVGINTSHPNAIVEEAIRAGEIPEIAGYETLKREVKYGQNSRIDILLSDPDKGLCYVEIKNVHLKRDDAIPGLAEFPDAVTKRGAKHLDEMTDMVAQGHRAVMFYLIQRTDCDSFTLAHDIDPHYAARFCAATASGVEAIAYDCAINTSSVTVRQKRPIILAP